MTDFEFSKALETEFSKLKNSVESLNSSLEFISLLRTIGYGMLLLAFVDLVEAFVPPNFMNPGWEFQTMGRIVERVAVPLIGLVFVFSGKLEKRSAWERRFLALLSYLTLLVGLLYILLVPLGVVNTIRLYNNNTNQITNQYNQQLSQANQLEKRLSEATPQEIENLLRSQGGSLNGRNPEEFKNQIASSLTQAKQQLKTQVETTKSAGRLSLFRSSVKWNLGALISAALFITFWRRTAWARKNTRV
ncbi:HpsJ-like protein, cyanoexosortase A-associated [Anabaena sp. CA = ATCC 33047]|uniref:HpsJ-like protein, cyanoexosortase A-associated n=1 Tax=Anabaena sp. (strain CA / ATCC 33047) TaxID=52271 RepID=UPI00083063EB|nr:HpsJ family protein [Anabaena sp. CA = ATCC 33047]